MRSVTESSNSAATPFEVTSDKTAYSGDKRWTGQNFYNDETGNIICLSYHRMLHSAICCIRPGITLTVHSIQMLMYALLSSYHAIIDYTPLCCIDCTPRLSLLSTYSTYISIHRSIIDRTTLLSSYLVRDLIWSQNSNDKSYHIYIYLFIYKSLAMRILWTFSKNPFQVYIIHYFIL